MSKLFYDEVATIKARVIEAIPVGASFAAIIVALARLIIEYQNQAMENDE